MRARDDFTLPSPRLPRAALVGLPSWVAPGPGTEERLAGFFSEALNLDAVGADDDFFMLGGTSLQAAAIFSQIQNQLGRRLPLAALYRSPTVRSLARAIDKTAPRDGTPAAPQDVALPASPAAHPGPSLGPSPEQDCVLLLRAGTSGRSLFVAPGIGGDVIGLGHLARQLHPALTIYGLRSIGLQEGEEPLTGVPAIAAAFVAGLRRVQPRGPYHLFGVCWGGLVVLEMARQLNDAGEEVNLLALLDPPPVKAGGAASAQPPHDRAPKAPSTGQFLLRRLKLYRSALARRPLREWPAYLGGRLVNITDVLLRRDPFRGDPTEFLRWRVREANLHALRRYDPPEWPGNGCLLFTSERADGNSRAARTFWTGHFRADGREIFVPGKDSGDALAPERAGAVAQALNARLGG